MSDSHTTQIQRFQNRRFSVSDTMVLIAAIALAIWGGSRVAGIMAEQFMEMCRTVLAHDSLFYAKRPQVWSEHVANYWGSVLWYGLQVIEVLVLSMTPAFLLVRLRKPRPSLPALLRQPGSVAGLAVTIGYLWVFGWLDRLFPGTFHFRIGTAVAVGGTVAVAWALLALSRSWQAEPSWVDRMGRLIGAAAIAVAVLVIMLFGT